MTSKKSKISQLLSKFLHFDLYFCILNFNFLIGKMSIKKIKNKINLTVSIIMFNFAAEQTERWKAGGSKIIFDPLATKGTAQK